MQVVPHGRPQQLRLAKRKGGHKQSYTLHICHRIRAPVGRGQQRARLHRSQACRRQGKHQVPREVPPASCSHHMVSVARRGCHPTIEAGGDIVGMTLPAARLFQHLPVRPAKPPKVVRQQHPRQQSRRRRAAPHAERNLIVEPQQQRRRISPCKLPVGRQDQASLRIRAEVRIAACRVDMEGWCHLRLDRQVQPHRQTKRVEARAKVSGSSWKA